MALHFSLEVTPNDWWQLTIPLARSTELRHKWEVGKLWPRKCYTVYALWSFGLSLALAARQLTKHGSCPFRAYNVCSLHATGPALADSCTRWQLILFYVMVQYNISKTINNL